MKIKPISEIEEFIKKVVEPLGVRLVEVEFKQGKNPSLTLFIDKEGGVDINTCELVHNAVNEPLDILDPTFGKPYTLNVSSVGLDRPFKSEEDFNSHIGKFVEVWLKTSVGGKKEYDGELKEYDGKIIRIKLQDGNTLTFDLSKQVEKVNNYIEF